MSTGESYMDRPALGGVMGLIAESLARRPTKAGTGEEGGPRAAGPWRRLAEWFWRQKRHGVEADLARSRDVFQSLDRWLWKQQLRETEAWLAQSKDVYELEARIRRLERGPAQP